MSLGEEIRRARELHGLTQPELAERVGVSESTISNWERGKSVPRNKLAKLRQLLGMDLPGELPPPAPRRAVDLQLADLDDGELWALQRRVMVEIERRYLDARSAAVAAGSDPEAHRMRRGMLGVPESVAGRDPGERGSADQVRPSG